MSIDFETAMAIQRICTGETLELSRGKLASEAIDFENETRNYGPEKKDACRAFYNELINNDENKLYDAESLLSEIEEIKAEFAAFVETNDDADSFMSIFEAISEFFMTPPFEGLDSIEYGVNEVCVFSALEYFKMKLAANHDHEGIRNEYRQSIADRTYEEVADHWIGVYDNLQSRYEIICSEIRSEAKTSEECESSGRNIEVYGMVACAIIAISAIRDQDEFSLDMAQAGAKDKGISIGESLINDTYKPDESSFVDNVVKLYEFIKANI